MRLIVTNETVDATLDTIVMSVDEFCDVHSHPFIASSGFDCILVDLHKEIKPGFLRAMLGKYMIVPRIVTDIDTDTVRLLAELYPEYAAKLRYTFITKRSEELSSIISELSDKFCWYKYYSSVWSD